MNEPAFLVSAIALLVSVAALTQSIFVNMRQMDLTLAIRRTSLARDIFAVKEKIDLIEGHVADSVAGLSKVHYDATSTEQQEEAEAIMQDLQAFRERLIGSLPALDKLYEDSKAARTASTIEAVAAGLLLASPSAADLRTAEKNTATIGRIVAHSEKRKHRDDQST